MLGRKPPAFRRRDERAFGDAEQRILRLEIAGRGKIGFVGRDQRHRMVVGKVDKRGLEPALALEAMALQLDIEPVSEHALEALQPRQSDVIHAGAERPIERACGAAGQREQTLAIVERVKTHVRFVAVLGVEPDL